MSNPFRKFSELVQPIDLDRNAADPRRAGAPIRAVRELVRNAWLYWAALAIAYLGAAVASVSLFSVPVRNEWVFAASVVQTVTAALLFLRCAFDARFRAGLDTANRLAAANRRRTGRVRLLDPYWGMFSPYNGPLPCRVLFPILLVESLGVAWLGGRGWGDVYYLSFASLFVTTELVLLYVGLNTEPDNGRW